MAIEKMSYVNIVGLTKYMNDAIHKCTESGCFHIEEAFKTVNSDEEELVGKLDVDSNNPYRTALRQLLNMNFGAEYKFHKVTLSGAAHSSDTEITDYVAKISAMTEKNNDKRAELLEVAAGINKTLEMLEHIKSLDLPLHDLYECREICIRFGKLPLESEQKLSFFDDERNVNFEFVSFEKDLNYSWGIVFALREDKEEVDRTLADLYFERAYIPETVIDKPEQEIIKLKDAIAEIISQINVVNTENDKIAEEHFGRLNECFCRLKSAFYDYSLRTKAIIVGDSFYLVGFVPTKQIGKLSKSLEDIASVEIVIRQAEEAEKDFSVPVKLKNDKFSRPFGLFVELYGLPNYHGINPTSFVAWTYTILFGIMFGDVGQGFIIALLGFWFYRKTKVRLLAIMGRIGISSMIFGVVYGSVFGFEEALAPFYHALGFEHRHNLFSPISNMLIPLLGAVGIGVVLILTLICINIVLKLKEKDYVEGLFGNNGVAGLLFYGLIITAAVMTFTGSNWFTLPLWIVLIVLVLMMFFKEPLGHKISGRHDGHEKTSVSDFILVNFFECFDYLLSYATNTLSFVRVGAFVLSHVNMMLVVMILGNVTEGSLPDTVGGWITVVLGNLFVMGMEGAIVGIQVLRLEFYEIFSRFYDGDGKPFTPLNVKYEVAE
jgi:V/A-type H+-transporting ATPase subunit I